MRQKDKPFQVLVFPSNSFRKETGTLQQVKERYQRYSAFPLFSPVRVNGPKAAPVFSFLSFSVRGVGDVHSIRGNFEIFLVDRDGVPVSRYPPMADLTLLDRMITSLLP